MYQGPKMTSYMSFFFHCLIAKHTPDVSFSNQSFASPKALLQACAYNTTSIGPSMYLGSKLADELESFLLCSFSQIIFVLAFSFAVSL